MKINEILQPGSVHPNRGTGSRSPSVAPAPSSGIESGVDRAELHGDARLAGQVLESAKLVLKALPDVRADRVEQAKKRLAEGFYDQPGVIDRIAARMAADPEAHPAAPLSLEQQAQIRQRLAEGFYESPKAVDKIAAGLAEEA